VDLVESAENDDESIARTPPDSSSIACAQSLYARTRELNERNKAHDFDFYIIKTYARNRTMTITFLATTARGVGKKRRGAENDLSARLGGSENHPDSIFINV
jgi:hypothetical protein